MIDHSVLLFVVSVGEITYKRKTQKEIRPKRLVTIENSSTPVMVNLRTVCCRSGVKESKCLPKPCFTAAVMNKACVKPQS
jgi:hypothetical protein